MAWAVTIRCPDEADEVAAVFVARDDAQTYTMWWNREEMRRYGRATGVAATTEETDFYPEGVWRPRAQPHVPRLP